MAIIDRPDRVLELYVLRQLNRYSKFVCHVLRIKSILGPQFTNMKARFENNTFHPGSSCNGCRRRRIGASIVFLFLAITTTRFAQAAYQTSVASTVPSSASSNVEIIKLQWKREVRLPRNFDPAVIPTGGTFNDPTTRITPASTADATRVASSRGTADSSSGTFPATPSRLPVFYVYSMKVKNVGFKPIEGIAWDYIFIDPNLHSEIGRHQFLTYAKIPTTKTTTLRGDLRTRPIILIGAPTSGSNKHFRYIERGVVQCVLYEDESVWKNPSGRPGVCEFLKSKNPVKQKHGAGRSQ